MPPQFNPYDPMHFQELNPNPQSVQGVPPGGYQPSNIAAPADPTKLAGPTGMGGQLDEAAYQRYQDQFNSLFPGQNVSSEDLLANADKLRAMGMEVQTNASGRAGKVKLPNGDIIDVVGGGEHGANIKQWGYGPGSPMSTGNWAAGPIEGGGDSGTLGGMMGGGTDYGARLPALEKTPGYQFRMQQGMDALNSSAAAKGTLLTGGAAKDAMQFGQGLASTEFDNEYRRLFGIAGLGQGAAGTIGNYGSSYGDNATNLITGQGDARASGTIGGANATSNFLGQAGQTATDLYMYDQWNKNRQPANSLGVTGDYRVGNLPG